MKVVLGEADSYINPGNRCSFWDLCAPEAILRAMGGILTDENQNRLRYTKERNGGSTLIPGFFIGKTSNMHALIFNRIQKEKVEFKEIELKQPPTLIAITDPELSLT